MSQTQRPDPYASEAESAALLVPDTRTPAERTLETLLEDAYYNEQGAEPLHVLRRVALELVEKMAERVPLTREQASALITEAGYSDAPAHARADFLNGLRHGEAAHGITKGST